MDSMSEEPVFEHVCLDTTWASAAGEACCLLCNHTLLKAVDRQQLQAIRGSGVSIKILLRWHMGGRMLLMKHVDDGAAGL